ncbi:sodium channel protein Nach [Amyelois transitella]|uniref:sodium channel protein Nach n=1 Tax=Amyelois transitella TaxID=680683 RepID=UPI0029901FC5|nr:sodium channel protein Nach [Amyelois transitella]
MRTVDPGVWLRDPVYEAWSRKQTDKDLESRLRRSFSDAAREFWRHASLRGTLISNRRCVTTWDTARNVFAASFAFFLAVWLVTYNVREQTARPPLQVNALSTRSPTEVRFPAIALCSNNVISKDKLEMYIEFLTSRASHNKTYNTEYLVRNILHFGAFLTKTLPRVDVSFIDLLQHKNETFNVTQLMYQLSPNCSSLLRTCAWAGSLVDCAQLFAMRITPLGFCCVFNSRYQPEDINAKPWVSRRVGQSTGLVVVYTENDEDYAYLRRPALGVEVLLFDGDEYPLLETGVTRLYPVQRNTSMFFSLNLRDIRSSSDLGSYSESWRRCGIRAAAGPAAARASYGWCLLRCRRRTAAALCDCVPYTLMPSELVCSIGQLPCLDKHKANG